MRAAGARRPIWAVTVLLALAVSPAVGAEAPDAVQTACERGRRLLLGGEAGQAERDLAELLRGHPCQACATTGRVEALIELDRWEEGLELAQECHALRPQNTAIAAALGEALFRAGRVGRAERVMAEIASRGDLEGPALSLLGLLHAAAGRADAAHDAMQRAVAASPVDRRVLYRAAEAASDSAEAIGWLEGYLERSEGDDPDRIRAAEGSLRTLRALGDRQVWVLEDPPENVELRMGLLESDAGEGAGAVVTARVGGARKPVRLLLDTGSSGLFLSSRIAKKRGLETLAEETAYGGGGDRRHDSLRGLFPRFELGPLSFDNALATISRYEFDPAGRYHGVLGVTMLSGYRVSLDLRRGRLILDREGQASDGSRYWVIAGQLLVEAGPPEGPTGLFLLDTGASSSLLDLAYARSIPSVEIGEEAPLRGYGGLMQGARVARGVTLAFQGLDTGGAALRVTDLSLRSRLGGVQIAGFLGMDLLRHATVVIESGRQRVRVSRAE